MAEPAPSDPAPDPTRAVAVPTLVDSEGTDAVTIRALREDDVVRCWEQCVDPLSQRWTTVPIPYGLDDARAFCLEIAPACWADGSQWIFAVEADGRYQGNIALRPEAQGGGARAEVAFGAHPEARGTGVMRRAVGLLLDWGFAARGVQTVVWYANVGNWGSRRLAWSLGFSFDGVLRGFLPHRGEMVDAWVGVLTAADARQPRGRWLDTPVLESLPGDLDVRLRPLRDDDVARVVEACSDPTTAYWLSRTPSPYATSDAVAWFENVREEQATGAGTTWAVVDPDTDVLLASVSVFDHTPGRQAELGCWTHPDARGRGVMTSAVRRIVRWAFDDLGVVRVRAMAGVDNPASWRVMERAGMRRGGVERLGTRNRAGAADAYVYDALFDDDVWASRTRA